MSFPGVRPVKTSGFLTFVTLCAIHAAGVAPLTMHRNLQRVRIILETDHGITTVVAVIDRTYVLGQRWSSRLMYITPGPGNEFRFYA
jgi:hypothetical protein